MADAPAATAKGGKSGSFGFLTRKLGFMPVWGWGLAAFGGYYWYTHYGPGKTAATANQVTDPAGNTCSVLAPSGFCPGSAEDMAAQQSGATPAGGSDTGGTGGDTGTGTGGDTGGTLPVPPMPPVPPPPPPGPPPGPKPKPKPKPRPGPRPRPNPPPGPGDPHGPPVVIRPRPPGGIRRTLPPRPIVPPDTHGPPVVAPPPGTRPPPRPVPGPVPVVAPMTAGHVYGGIPTSNINGSTYVSPRPTETEMRGAYVPA